MGDYYNYYQSEQCQSLLPPKKTHGFNGTSTQYITLAILDRVGVSGCVCVCVSVSVRVSE